MSDRTTIGEAAEPPVSKAECEPEDRIEGRWSDLYIEARGGIGAFASKIKAGKVCVWFEFAGDNQEVFLTPDEARRLARVFRNAARDAAGAGAGTPGGETT